MKPTFKSLNYSMIMLTLILAWTPPTFAADAECRIQEGNCDCSASLESGTPETACRALFAQAGVPCDKNAKKKLSCAPGTDGDNQIRCECIEKSHSPASDLLKMRGIQEDQ